MSTSHKNIVFPLSEHQMSFETSEKTLVSRTVLPNGVRILSESVIGAKSTTIGYWVAVGSRDEETIGFGSTHFLEHLLFKSTKQRSALDISTAFDAIGGEHNAATAHEYTCYYAHVRGDDLPIAIDVLSDMLTSAQLLPDEFETERQVIIEELAMSDDDPSDAVQTRFMTAVLGEHPVGRPIGGSIDSISRVQRDAVLEHYARFYRPDELVITAAGAVDHAALVERVSNTLKAGGWDFTTEQSPVARRNATAVSIPASEQVIIENRPTEQVHLMLGMPSLNFTDERRFAQALLGSALGGGMSSRLFQEVREKRGLAYSVYAFSQSFSDVGVFAAYAGTTTKNAQNVLSLLVEQLRLAADKGLSAAELELVRGQHIGSLALGSESTAWRMNRLGSSEIRHGEFFDYEESISRIQAVTLEEVNALASDILSKPIAFAAVGNLDSKSLNIS
ncbi:MAG: pitrilysin family protein [Microbacteriaceae bacterium]